GGGGGGRYFAQLQEKQEATDYKIKVKKDTWATFSFTGTMSIKDILLTAKETLYYPKITVKMTEITPKTIIWEKVYQYNKVQTENFDDTQIKEATIRFKIPKTWMQNNKVQPKDIILKRLEKEWTELPTKFTDFDGENYNFKADSPGLSYFAITAKKQIKTKAENNRKPNKQNTNRINRKQGITGREYTKRDLVLFPTQKKKNNKIGTYIMLTILSAIAGIACVKFMTRKKRKK
ncbi:hypothetical protein DRJ22_04255, partial [Candidatus Woesearchaeota archaeon]